MSVAVRGKVVRFDHVKGYGFVRPLHGGDDVFLHVNDLLDEKYLINTDSLVEYFESTGDRGPKASSVKLVADSSMRIDRTDRTEPSDREPVSAPAPAPERSRSTAFADPDEEFIDLLPQETFVREVTDFLLELYPELTGSQILAIRRRFVEMGEKYKWIGE